MPDSSDGSVTSSDSSSLPTWVVMDPGDDVAVVTVLVAPVLGTVLVELGVDSPVEIEASEPLTTPCPQPTTNHVTPVRATFKCFIIVNLPAPPRPITMSLARGWE
jgi:hypothetical protein